MTWTGQLVHIVKKDLRALRWPLIIYVAILALGIVSAFTWSARHADGSDVGAAASMLTLALGVALAVQSDWPIDVRSFWASHPLERSAMLGAKLCLALLLLTVGLVAQGVAMSAFGIASGEIVWGVWTTMRTCGELMLLALFGAVLTRDIKSLALLAVAVPIASLAVSVVLQPLLPDFAFPVGSLSIEDQQPLVRLSLLAIQIAALAWIYRTRDRVIRARIIGIAALFLPFAVGIRGASRVDEPPTLPAAITRPVIRVHAPANGGPLGTTFELQLEAAIESAPLGQELRLTGVRADVLLRNGEHVRVPMSATWVENDRADGVLPVLAGVAWSSRAGMAGRRFQLVSYASDAERRLARSGIERIVVTGHATLFDIRPDTLIRLRQGRSPDDFTLPGRHVRLDEWSFGPQGPELRISVDEVARPRLRPGLGAASSIATSLDGTSLTAGNTIGPISYALVNRPSGEGRGLRRLATQYNGRSLPLPGVSRWHESVRYGDSRFRMEGDSTARPDRSWYGDVDLLITKQVLLGTYPIRIEATIP